MMEDRRTYLRTIQYRVPDRLEARARLHARYGRGDWFPWLAAHIPLPPRAVVADIGCGAGAFWSRSPETVPSDLGLRLFDLSDGMVDAASAALQALGRWGDVQATVADAVALPMADASVDTVMAIHMLYHLDDPAAGLREMARIVRPGGVVAIVLNPAGTMATIAALMDEAADSTPTPPPPLSSEQGLTLMRAHFPKVEVVRYDDDLVVTDPADLLGYLFSLPAADRPGVRERLRIGVDAAFRASNGVVTIGKSAELLLGRL